MKYVILRDPQRWPAGGAGREVPFRGHPPENQELPSIEVEDVNAKERSDLARDPAVRNRLAVQMPIRLIKPQGSSADNDNGDSWGIAAVQADVSLFTGAGTRVAVLDTGIERAHPAFAGMDIEERDFSGDGNGDRCGHGTHCAGTIFGRDVDGSRIGVARGVQKALIGKILGDDGAGSTDTMCKGITWAVDNSAQVISLSVGFDLPLMFDTFIGQGWQKEAALSFVIESYRRNLLLFDALMSVIRARGASGADCVVVAAAGNESNREGNPAYEVAASLPAASEGVLSTGALARSLNGYTIAPFSNTSPKLCAPGTGIKSAYPGGGLHTMGGTSMACPHVAGVAALWWEALGALPVRANAARVAARIDANCRTEGLAPGMDPAAYGSGLVTAP
jgi:subtilisin family serine protease